MNLSLLQMRADQRFARVERDLVLSAKMPQQALSIVSVLSRCVWLDVRSIIECQIFGLTLGDRFFAIFPRHIVVFVRIPGCSSFAVRAKNRKSSPLMTLSDSFPMIVKTALTVCSRTTGATSVNPDVYFLISKMKPPKKDNIWNYHLWENLVGHKLLRETIYHQGKIVQ